MSRPAHVLAVASAGGHWVELRRLAPAWAGCRVSYLSTRAELAAELAGETGPDGRAPRLVTVPDATRWDRIALARQALGVAAAVLRLRPDAVVTTGAAPGYFALRAGRLIGARTVWVDSLANVEALSMSGAMAGRHADLWLTQWPELAAAEEAAGPRFAGRVL